MEKSEAQLLAEKLDALTSKLDLLLNKLVDKATDRTYIPMKTHFITMLVTVGLLGGVQVFNSYQEAKKFEKFTTAVAGEVAEVSPKRVTKP